MKAEYKIIRKSNSHKGENGRILIIGGSIDYAGAVMLSAMAAFRSGVDIVTVAAPEKVAWAINAFSPDIITRKFKGNYFTKSQAKEIIKLADNFDVVLIGNGIGTRKETKSFAKEIIRKIKKPLVIDADAIKAISLNDVNNAIMTPHKEELRILLHNTNLKQKNIGNLQRSLKNNVILLKGKIDLIISKDRISYNKTGNSGMTVGGTGDVLAGLAAGILAQNKNLFQTVCLSAYVNGKAGDLAFKKYRYGLTASDLIDKIPNAMKGVIKEI